MTTYAISGSAHKRDALALKSFDTYGAMSGVAERGYNSGRLRGHAERAFQAERASIDYVIYSWATPIAWHTPDGWTRVIDTFSNYTSRQQSSLYYLPAYRTVGFVWSFSDAQRIMLQAIRDDSLGYVMPTGQARRTAAVLLSRGVIEPHPTIPGAFQLTADTADRIAR